MKNEKIATGFVFTVFLTMVLYKLNYATLWYDETIEYWTSKIMFGELPFALKGDTVNMYQRIITTYQPPLYNLLMWVWLQIHDSALWFRLFSAVCGFAGMVGLFKAVKLNSNVFWADLCVFVCSFTYQLIYYFQECAEYSLMLCFLCWMLYYYSKAIRSLRIGDIVIFTLFAILAIYSQYGASFVAIPLFVSIFIVVIRSKNKKVIKSISITYAISALCSAVPLIVFFLIPQITNQQNGANIQVTFNGYVIMDFINAIFSVVKSNFFFIDGINDVLIKLFVAFVVTLSVFVLICGSSRVVKHIIISLFTTFILYYISVKFGFYAVAGGHSAGYYNRYSIFFIPLLIFTCFIIISETCKIVCSCRYYDLIHSYSIGVVLCLTVLYCVVNWNHKLYGGMEKVAAQDPKGAVKKWYQIEGYKLKTIVDGGLISGFAFYERHHNLFDEQLENNVIVDYASDSIGQVDFVEKQFANNYPQTFYSIFYTYGDNLNTFINILDEFGYSYKDVYYKDNVKLICFTHNQ